MNQYLKPARNGVHGKMHEKKIYVYLSRNNGSRGL